MERMTLVFWTVIVCLLGTSAFYGFSAEQRRSKVQKTSGIVNSGDLLNLVQVLDGDSILAGKAGEEPVGLRLVGIKAFDAKVEKDVMTPFAQAGVELLKRELANKPLRVSLSASSSQDKYGRYLATIYADDQDISLKLIREGLALVYPVYPFPSLSFYLQEQELAHAKRRGFWSHKQASERAMAQMREWRSQSE